MNHLLRGHAPITEGGWEEIDAEAVERLRPALAARRFVDFDGPLGWDHSATNLGRVGAPEGDVPGVSARERRVLPVVEMRAPFSVSRSELRARDRGAADMDLDALAVAAHAIAVAENRAVFHGLSLASSEGIAGASPHPPVKVKPGDYVDFPSYVAEAIQLLLLAGVTGPYGVALGPDAYTGVITTTEPAGGYPVLDHLREIIDGPLVWAPGVEGAVVASLRGGDFLFESGQDISVGYDHHDADDVHLYLEESFTFRVASPEAAVALVPTKGRK